MFAEVLINSSVYATVSVINCEPQLITEYTLFFAIILKFVHIRLAFD